MTTPAQGPPAEKGAPRKPNFIQITHDQLAMPKACRGAPPNGTRVSKLEFLVLQGLEKLSWGGKKSCFATNLEIAKAIGLTGTDDTLKRQIRIALGGRTYRKGRWDPETGRHQRDGEVVTIPGLCDPSRGFVEVRQAGPSAPRELVLTSRWLEWGRIRVFEGGNGGPTEADPATAGVSAIPPACDGPTGPVGTHPPEAPEATEPVPTAAIAAGTTAATDGENAASPVEQPSAEALAEALGQRFVHRSREDQASKLVQKLDSRTIRLRLTDDGRIHPMFGACGGELSPSEQAVLICLKPELVELLKREAEKSKPGPKAGGPPGGGKPAPPVFRAAEVRAMIGRLISQPAADDADCRALASRLVTDQGFRHNDADPATSEATYFGLALDTKREALGLAVMTEAFESACGPKVRNRGAMMVAEVKRMKAAGLAPRPADGVEGGRDGP